MIYIVSMKALLNLTCAAGFAITHRWACAVLFIGCALADIGTIMLLKGSM